MYSEANWSGDIMFRPFRFISGEYVSSLRDQDDLGTFELADVRKAYSR
jgi:hypothetical protein